MDKLFELPEIVTLDGQPVDDAFDSNKILEPGTNKCRAGSGTGNTCKPGGGLAFDGDIDP